MSTLFKDFPANMHVALANYGIDVRVADRIDVALRNDEEASAIVTLMEATGMDERGATIALREALNCREGRTFQSRRFADTMELPA